MIDYLLDTNILSDLVRSPEGAAAVRFRRERADIGTSIFVAAEMRFGLRSRPGHRMTARVEELLVRLPVLPFEKPGDEIYAQVRDGLTRAGTPIGANDLWIAAHALVLDCILVTANECEFRRVPGLRVENWLG